MRLPALQFHFQGNPLSIMSSREDGAAAVRKRRGRRRETELGIGSHFKQVLTDRLLATLTLVEKQKKGLVQRAWGRAMLGTVEVLQRGSCAE